MLASSNKSGPKNNGQLGQEERQKIEDRFRKGDTMTALETINSLRFGDLIEVGGWMCARAINF